MTLVKSITRISYLLTDSTQRTPILVSDVSHLKAYLAVPHSSKCTPSHGMPKENPLFVLTNFGLNKHVHLVDVWLFVTECDLWHDNHLSQPFTCCVHLADSFGTSWHTLSFNFVGSHGNHRDVSRGNVSYSSVNPLSLDRKGHQCRTLRHGSVVPHHAQ